MSYLVFDLETQIHKSHKRKANPWHPENFVVMRGWKMQGDKCASWHRFTGKHKDNWLRIDPRVTVLVGHNIKFDLLYEMANCNNPELRAFFKRGGRIWDTQYAEYLLNMQDRRYHMVAMDQIAESYGGRVKIDQIKALWEAGVQTVDIDPDLLTDYLVGTEDEGRNSGDIGNTEKIYLGQLKAAKELGMMNAILQRMEGLGATIEMEYNGVMVDTERAYADLEKLNAKSAETEKELHQYVADIPEEVGFSWGSRVHTSCLIYGGTIKYQMRKPYTDEKTGELARKIEVEKWPLFKGNPVNPTELWYDDERGLYCTADSIEVIPTDDGDHEVDTTNAVWQDTFKGGKRVGEGRTKNVKVPGELKIKWQDYFYDLDGFVDKSTVPDSWKTKNNDGAGNPLYSTSSDMIEELAKRDIPFLQAMGKLQALTKEIGTYYIRYDEKKKEHVGMLTCVMDNGIVHHSLNHTSTVTTRLSSNNPNAQNFPRGDKSDVKAMFVSRFGEDGRMCELDYSQLEVVVQGLLSLDRNLVRDLNDKVDFHCKRVALKCSVSYEFALFHCKEEEAEDHDKWKFERTKCKNFSFQRAYGAGAAAIAADTGIDEEEIKQMIRNEEAEYPGVVRFNSMVEAAVNDTATPFRAGPDEGYRTFRKGFWQAPTGTCYRWRSYDAPSFLKRKGIEDTFKPTEMKNYPVQGTGGEIVQMIIGRLWRYFMHKDNWGGKALLVNTVHDCVWLDVHKDHVQEVCRVVKKIMESVPMLLKKNFGIDCPVPFPVDAEAGINMLELHHVD